MFAIVYEVFLTILLIVLKLSGYLDCSWLLVLLPIYYQYVLVIVANALKWSIDELLGHNNKQKNV